MGTPEQKAHRQAWEQNQQQIWSQLPSLYRGVSQAQGDANLRAYLESMGQNPNGPMYKQNYSEGPYAIYGPSFNIGLQHDFNAGQVIPWMGEGQTWYDPSVASNWQPMDPLERARTQGFYNWRNTPEGISANSGYGGNSLAAWLGGRAQSNRPNSPDMSWLTNGAYNYATGAGTRPGTLGGLVTPPAPVAPQPLMPPPPTSTSTPDVSTFAQPSPLTQRALSQRYPVPTLGGLTQAGSLGATDEDLLKRKYAVAFS